MLLEFRKIIFGIFPYIFLIYRNRFVHRTREKERENLATVPNLDRCLGSFGSCVNRNETGATCGGNSFPFTAAVKNARADVSGCLFR